MANRECFRQPISSPLDFEGLRQRLLEGWKPVAIEWEREMPADEAVSPSRTYQTPFGCQLAEDALGLEENRTEMEILLRMMELLVEEVPYSYIADELNRSGFRTRAGRNWSQISVFEMLPRLIELGPAIFSSAEWRNRRRGGMRVESPGP